VPAASGPLHLSSADTTRRTPGRAAPPPRSPQPGLHAATFNPRSASARAFSLSVLLGSRVPRRDAGLSARDRGRLLERQRLLRSRAAHLRHHVARRLLHGARLRRGHMPRGSLVCGFSERALDRARVCQLSVTSSAAAQPVHEDLQERQRLSQRLRMRGHVTAEPVGCDRRRPGSQRQSLRAAAPTGAGW